MITEPGIYDISMFRRYEDKIQVLAESGCWIWMGSVAPNGYGKVGGLSRGSSPRQAHRAFFESVHGIQPAHISICHRCDVPCCVRPDHLFAGSRSDNMRDMYIKGRGGIQKLLPSDIPTVFEMYRRGMKQREIADAFGCSQTNISAVLRRKSWGFVDAKR